MKIKIVSSLFLAASLLGVSARAQQVVSHSAEISNLSPGVPQVLNLPGFDPSRGQLTAVTLTFSSEIWQSVFGENLGLSAASYTLSSSTQLSVTKNGGPAVFALPPATVQSHGEAGAFDGSFDFNGDSGFRVSRSVSSHGIYMDSQLSQYVGVGGVEFTILAAMESLQQASAEFAHGSTVTLSAGLTVDYAYTSLAAIPEPSTYAALMSAVIFTGVALIRRRTGVVAGLGFRG